MKNLLRNEAAGWATTAPGGAVGFGYGGYGAGCPVGYK